MDKKAVSTLGKNIKKVRQRKKMSAYKLSRLSGVAASTISQIETGQRMHMNSPTLIKIAEALGVSAEDLLFNEGEIEFVVNDAEEAILVVLSSDELTIDNQKVTKEEKELIEKYLHKAIRIIRSTRRDLK